MAEVQAPTKHQDFKIMSRRYFSTKVKCLSTFWSAFFVRISFSGRLKQVFRQLTAILTPVVDFPLIQREI